MAEIAQAQLITALLIAAPATAMGITFATCTSARLAAI